MISPSWLIEIGESVQALYDRPKHDLSGDRVRYTEYRCTGELKKPAVVLVVGVAPWPPPSGHSDDQGTSVLVVGASTIGWLDFYADPDGVLSFDGCTVHRIR